MPRLAALIFVSSTTEDLEDYRSALVRQFPRLDVLYRGMEFFGARHQPPKDVMLTEVGMCDLFLGILGNRYGSVDPESGLSYTELEYREAMRKRIPTLMFVMDPAQAITPARFESDAGKRQQLDSFKEAVRKEHAVRHFRSPEDFASEAIDGIRRWLVEHADEWKTTKIEPKEKDFIRMLYSESADTMERAVQKLRYLGSRLSLEHFYSLLHRGNLPLNVQISIFDTLILSPAHARVTDILEDMLQKPDPYLCSQAIRAVGDRVTNDSTPCPDSLVDAILTFESDPRESVRVEVAHSLPKIIQRRPDLRARCLDMILRLCNDESSQVAATAMRALQLSQQALN